MKKAKSRLPHNKNKKEVTFIEFGLIPRKRREYAHKKSSIGPLLVLTSSIIVTASLRIIPSLVKAQEISPIKPTEIKIEENLVREVQTSTDMAQPSLEPEPFPQASSQSEDKLVQISVWAAEAVNEFIPKTRRSEALMTIQCLLHRESRHDEAQACGDGGKSCGALQFRVPTWNRMRGQMIKQSVAVELGSMYDTKEAIRTTVWAMNNGNAKEWGPIYRDSKGSDYASCQTPSWYKN